MARLYVNGPVIGRKPKVNPWTVSGHPQWNTYAGMGMITAARELRIQASAMGVRTGGGRGKRKKLDPSNLAHRTNPTDRRHQECRQAFDAARRLSLQIDNAGGADLDPLLNTYTQCVRILRAHRSKWLNELIRLEKARGVGRAVFTR